MSCSAFLPTIDFEEVQRNEQRIQESALSTSQEVLSGGKQIRMIKKQHRIHEVSFAGEGWFDEKGRWSIHNNPKESFKYKIGYTNKINNQEHFWVFN
jgi:hypothetical protein